ncbi:3-keto-steroid reductase [Polyrhizophydium stewartii]|uniref:3-keto-steroid reductase n=1 Tax=Polyrhizophydium stewartii TaxID=2732419 RepID=A0ABR4MXT2_9FUNG|nr:hypothetical protein HK105_008217 [Polyrhizophydium stewartii]
MLSATAPLTSADSAFRRSAAGSADAKVILVTGANRKAGVGLGIVERLIEQSEKASEPITVVMACRSKSKAEEARERLLGRYFPGANRAFGERALQLLLVDLANTRSVFAAAAEFKRRFQRLDSLVLNAGVIPISHVSYANGFKDVFTRPVTLALTGGDAIVQRVGSLTAEGLGESFASNVFGHYLLVRELEDLLSVAGDSRVIWTTSTSANSEFGFDDIQSLKSNHSYERCKRQCELIALEMHNELSKRGIYSFLSSPGILSSGILQDMFPALLLLVVMMIFRICGASGVNITGRNASTSAVYLSTVKNPNALDGTKIYHSEINFFGKRYVRQLSIDHGDPAKRREMLLQLEALRRKFRDLAVSDGIID